MAGEKMGETTTRSGLPNSLVMNPLVSSCRTNLCFSRRLIGIFVCLKASPLAESRNTYRTFSEVKRILKATGGFERGALCRKNVTLLGRRATANFLNSFQVFVQRILPKPPTPFNRSMLMEDQFNHILSRLASRRTRIVFPSPLLLCSFKLPRFSQFLLFRFDFSFQNFKVLLSIQKIFSVAFKVFELQNGEPSFSIRVLVYKLRPF